MFQLIISILAIILAVALAGVSVYYGGAAFSNGSEAAAFATLTNQGSQIEAASTLFRAQEGASITAIADLAPDYLKQVPTSNTWVMTAGLEAVYVAGVATAVCASDDAMVTLIATDTLSDASTLVSASTLEEVVIDQTGVSGCVDVTGASDGDSRLFFYNL